MTSHQTQRKDQVAIGVDSIKDAVGRSNQAGGKGGVHPRQMIPKSYMEHDTKGPHLRDILPKTCTRGIYLPENNHTGLYPRIQTKHFTENVYLRILPKSFAEESCRRILPKNYAGEIYRRIMPETYT